jgi:hypothetical protein
MISSTMTKTVTTMSNHFTRINSIYSLYKQKSISKGDTISKEPISKEQNKEPIKEQDPNNFLSKEYNLINYLIQKRINNISRLSEANHLCHIATFVDKKRKNNHLTIGINTNRKRFNNNKIAVHAEIDALQKLEKTNKKHKMDLIVLRVNKNGKLCESAPCRHCTIELSKNTLVNINKLYFSRSDGSITCIKFSEWLKKEDHHVSKGWKWLEETRENECDQIKTKK